MGGKVQHKETYGRGWLGRLCGGDRDARAERKAPLPGPPRDSNRRRSFLWYWLGAIALFWAAQIYFAASNVRTVPYSEFLQRLRRGQIAEVSISGASIHGKLKGPTDANTDFVTNQVDPNFAAQLDRYHVRFASDAGGNRLDTVFGWLAPVLIWAGIWFFLIRGIGRQGPGGLLSIGKSRVKVYAETNIGVTFDDVAGIDEAKAELKEIVSFLKDPERFGRLGAHMPKGVLLVGPPGTGKTLLAKAIAGEAGVPFFSISGAEFIEMFVGVGAARVRDLFEQARLRAPCIIFIDELDALGAARGFSALDHGEKEQTVDQLLAEMDGFDTRSGVVILAATNRPEILDPALLRAGRFDRHVLVDRPDKVGRRQILEVHLRKTKKATDADPETIAALTPGFTGADLANLVNEAAIHATRRNAEAVEMIDFTAAIERIVAGLEQRSRVMNIKEKRTIAWHEMGHALVALSLPSADPVHKVSIIPHGIGSLGFTMQRPTEDRFVLSRNELEGRLAVLLAGRAAEVIGGGELSTGAADDLAKATDVGRSMVLRYGMSDRLGHVVYEEAKAPYLGDGERLFTARQRDFSEETAALIDEEVRSLLRGAFERATSILVKQRDILERGANQLFERETLDEAALAELTGGHKAKTLRAI